MAVLPTQSWAANATQLLERIRDIDLSYPTFLMIRHSEREYPEDVREVLDAPLTDEGREGAREFGTALPLDSSSAARTRILYSPVERCVETAQYLAQGIEEREGGGAVATSFEEAALFGIRAGKQNFRDFLVRDSNDIMNHWVSGHYAPWQMEPSVYLSQRIARAWQDARRGRVAGKSETEQSQGRHRQTGEAGTAETGEAGTAETGEAAPAEASGGLDIAVSHDLHTSVVLFHWTGIFRGSENYVDPLDGFCVQEHGDYLTVITKDREKTVRAPYWWRLVSQP
jgi:broad specificity phosphatase PhoE